MTQTFCQSCAMPLKDEVLATEANGEKNPDYCIYCYENGAFKQPDLTMDEMIQVCVPFMVEEGMAQDEATRILKEQLPTLKRWQAR